MTVIGFLLVFAGVHLIANDAYRIGAEDAEGEKEPPCTPPSA